MSAEPLDGTLPAAADREVLSRAIRACLRPGAETVVVTWARLVPGSEEILRWMVSALERHGISRGRQTLLLSTPEGNEDAGPALGLGRAIGLATVVHDRNTSTCFPARAGEGVTDHVNDELREAEAVVIAGPQEVAGRLLVPGLLSHDSIAALDRESGAHAVPDLDVALAFAWDARGRVELLRTC